MEKKIYLLSADMGYGHQRAAFPLRQLAGGASITVNNYEGIDEKERKYWRSSLRSYEFISRFKKIPLLGDLVFAIMDEMQEIKPFYPFRDLSPLSFQQRFFLRSIKSGIGKGLMEKLAQAPRPVVSTFFVATYFTEFFDYPEKVYQVICDSDASRAWGPIKSDGKTVYLLPNEQLRTRFLMYGVAPERLVVTGFPLPKENIGENKEILRADLASRLWRLDPSGGFQTKYKGLISQYGLETEKDGGPVHLAFAVGGAGAQKEIAVKLAKNLQKLLIEKQVKLTLIAGTRKEVREYFDEELAKFGLTSLVTVLWAPTKDEYFDKFNALIRQIDLLWTKPSELSFYCALGLPIIMSETIGSQEDFNRRWLLGLGAGIDGPAPEYAAQWLADCRQSGRLAKAALDGFLNAESMGTYNIERIIG